MATLAAKAGVSEATVSRALANSPLIAEKTRLRIQRLAQKSGYSVNVAASSLRSRVTRTVSVAILLEHERRQTISDPFFLVLLGAIADALAERDHSLLLSRVEFAAADWLLQAQRSNQADGLIVIGQSLHHAALNRAAGTRFPMVVWGAQLQDQKYVTVGTDNEQGGFLATAHLADQGCRKIAFLGNTRLPEIAERHRGYRRALTERGLAKEPRLTLSVHFDGDAAYYEVASLLTSKLEVDGIVASSDVIAMSALRALAERGLRVPQDVAVSGFDDVPLASHTSPPLTTIRQDIARAGRLLVEKLMEQIAGREVGSTTLAAELIVRASSLRLPEPTATKARRSARRSPTPR